MHWHKKMNGVWICLQTHYLVHYFVLVTTLLTNILKSSVTAAVLDMFSQIAGILWFLRFKRNLAEDKDGHLTISMVGDRRNIMIVINADGLIYHHCLLDHNNANRC